MHVCYSSDRRRVLVELMLRKCCVVALFRSKLLSYSARYDVCQLAVTLTIYGVELERLDGRDIVWSPVGERLRLS